MKTLAADPLGHEWPPGFRFFKKGNGFGVFGGSGSGGAGGVRKPPLHLAIAAHLRDNMGPTSPVWNSTRQGHISRLLEHPEGMEPRSPGTQGERLRAMKRLLAKLNRSIMVHGI